VWQTEELLQGQLYSSTVKKKWATQKKVTAPIMSCISETIINLS
jgi:hypothetical protein